MHAANDHHYNANIRSRNKQIKWQRLAFNKRTQDRMCWMRRLSTYTKCHWRVYEVKIYPNANKL